jgi:exodeoxyribonuclease V alpha subunit
MSKPQEITATYLGEKFRFSNADGDTIIGRAWMNGEVSDEIAIKGQADVDELQTEQEYRFYGQWTSYKNKRTGEQEKQFAFSSFVLQAPHSRTGVIEYLRHAAEQVRVGFGPARATKLWDLYGSDAVKHLREAPEEVAARLSETPRLTLSADAARKIAAVLQEQAALEGCTLDLTDLLAGRGFPKSTARLATRAWGNRAAQIIRRCPYRLMEFRGCGFKKCDALYLDLGLPPGALKRQALCAWYTLARDTNGHTWFPLEFVDRGIRGSISATELKIERAIMLASRGGITAELQTDSVNGPIIEGGRIRWLAEGKNGRHETELGRDIADALREPVTIWPAAADLPAMLRSVDERITDSQVAELVKSLAGVVGILGGGPGCGKTWCVAVLVKLLAAVVGIENIGIGAPTGKAAVRITENLSAAGLTIRARTWHSLLALLERTGCKHFPYKVLIGDETSMNDTDLTARIFRSRAVGTHVLLVGDINQLPPVGHGAPLRDMIAAGLPYGELTEIMRNSGGIVETCAAIRQGKPWQPADNLEVFEHTGAEFQIKRMLQLIHHFRGQGLDPIWDCQVVVPVNKKSPLARRELNKILQAELNPNAGSDGSPFRTGDKIVNTANGYFPSVEFDESDPETQTNERGEVYVANGELAEVIHVEPKLTVARLANPARTVKIPRGKGTEERETDDDQKPDDNAPSTGCSWDLGYALSVHKSQGSEWSVVLVMIDEYPGAKMVCSREWLYTAISRAKKSCALIGKKTVADAMCRRVALGGRKTFLREQILLQKAGDDLAEL